MITLINSVTESPVRIEGINYNRSRMAFVGTSNDEKPSGIFNGTRIGNGSVFTEINTGKSYVYDEENAEWCRQDMSTASRGGADAGAQSLADVLEYAISSQVKQSRVVSLTATEFASGEVIETVGTPIYVSDVSEYTAYGLTDAGWYIFARITPKDGSAVNEQTSVEGGAGHILTDGAGYIDVAVKFEVAAMSQKVTIDWGTYSESFVFKATDLAIRNLDYRVTFYVYDADPFATWEYELTTDTTFASGKHYFTKGEDGTYTEAEITVGEAIPADTYYKHSKVTIEGLCRNVTYRLNTIVDCPMTFILPEIEDECHGAWYEIRCNHAGTYSMTLVPPSDDVKVATQHSQTETAGINMINLHYTSVAGLKMWRFMNTHSSVPA